ncbi:MAG: MBL fold metallo-hydrolase [Candidatus Pacebacteria bacterium]|jgi:L-ascorbate metabolism protein UlaG (beta-lactamase superfamily)|nr:MBL fold metallo-hydrolase [Candidatus Paceibacterota bacterium]MBT3511971.1 MBL fold metallo-hydrolase [Candidatus Paceibacterota bacterium]MBT4005293.1 MBL fold metallo-hydrolase [Candidatus Paceibacterota bacterium]MBT4358512.1 MBL fold metallo-hydrolase [Candidatus Paceibacterota bacterium]MBT4681160.1 MBL fold metallo-hydrolase [Candidatus Paceibacterota bacterium]
MIITYNGHSSFKLKGKDGSVVTDPFSSSIGFDFPKTSADIVTTSHDHEDHNQVGKVGKTARRDQPFVINAPGEYEVGGISVFGVKTSHDQSEGEDRGTNIIFTFLLDEMRVCHLGDLGHELSPEQIKKIGSVDVLLCPVGGVFTIDPKLAVKTIKSLEPSIVIPMHYKTPAHDEKTFGEVSTLEEFLKEYGVEVEAEEKLNMDRSRLPEETEVVVLRRG